MSKKKLVIVGNGMAPGRMLEHLFELAPDQFDVTIFNAEPRVNYNRLMLSPVLSGEKTYEDIITHDDAWYAANKVILHKGKRIDAIDRVAKKVTAADGTVAAYDKLVIATGSTPIIIPLPGHKLEGVVTYRDLDDVEKMLVAAERGGGKAVVIGGGLLGLEAAAGLKMQGMEISVVHLAPHLMERQLDQAAAHLLEAEFKRRGVACYTKANTKEILGEKKVEGVMLEDGTHLPCSMVVMAVGIRPSVALAKNSGIEVGRGILVNDQMLTNDADIYALGECAEHRGMVYGLVAPLYEMARSIAEDLAGQAAAYQGSVTFTKLKVTGVDLYSGGDFAEAKDREEIVLRDAARSIYKRLVIKDNKIIGVVMYGDTSDGPWFFDKLKKNEDISAQREMLIFGQAYAGGTPLDPLAAVAALPPDAEICGCNGVCKSKITDAISAKSLTSVDGVRAQTKASASCGSCTGLVEKLLVLSLGDQYKPNAVQPMCGCTDLGHADLRRFIIAKQIKTIPAVMQDLEWKTSCGCAKCRPALNYYLLCDWPGEYKDDSQSRFINERVHANIQKDGTYSVVPRMWGGMTSAKELRAIADVADKFSIPAVKVTGGQRIDLLGIKKEDLPAVWSDLNAAGMVSGAAYAKGLRTVKTCVGTDWCRFGTQDSTGLGIKLEKFMWGSWTPAKVKLAVSGCPRNCAEATCKDIGVICVDSGYDIHFAGAAGLDIKGTELLTHVNTEEEALEMIVALTQLYREQGHYLERIYKWAKRVGLESIRQNIVDDAEKRKTYFERFSYSQKFAQIDPWRLRASGVESREFMPMRAFPTRMAAE